MVKMSVAGHFAFRTVPYSLKKHSGCFSGQSYKHFMIVIYDSRVVPDWKIPHITTLQS